MSKNTVTLHRVFTAEPEKVYKAFTHAEAMAYWNPPYGFLCTVHAMDVRVGGKFKMSFTNFSTGKSHSFGGEFLQLIPNETIQYSDAFDDPNIPGQITTTIRLNKVMCGTEITITQEGLPDVIPVEMCYLGWQESVEKLKKLVETNIPDA